MATHRKARGGVGAINKCTACANILSSRWSFPINIAHHATNDDCDEWIPNEGLWNQRDEIRIFKKSFFYRPALFIGGEHLNRSNSYLRFHVRSWGETFHPWGMSRGLEVSSVSRRYLRCATSSKVSRAQKRRRGSRFEVKNLRADFLFPPERGNSITSSRSKKEIGREISLCGLKLKRINPASRFAVVSYKLYEWRRSIIGDVEKGILPLRSFVRVEYSGEEIAARLENVKRNLSLSSPRRNLIDHPFRQFRRIELPPRRRRRSRKSFHSFLRAPSIN